MGGRKHKHPEHENHERWLVSYADFITLLFATFTALYAIATADLAKLNKTQATAEAISKSFEEQSLVSGIKSIIQGKSPPNANPDPLSKKVGEGPGILGKYDSLVPKPGAVRSKDPTVQEMNAMMAAINEQLKALAGATLALENGGARISFDSTLLFDSGSSSLKPRAQQALKVIAAHLTGVAQTHRVIIEGHTDNQPIRSLFYPSNWELSAARACAVVRLLQTRAMPSSALSAVGYADTRPKGDNRTLAGRAKNRRIDVFIQGFAPVNEAVKPAVKLPAKTTEPKPTEAKPPAAKPAGQADHASKKPVVATLKTVISPPANPPKTVTATKKPLPDGFLPPRFEPLNNAVHK